MAPKIRIARVRTAVVQSPIKKLSVGTQTDRTQTTMAPSRVPTRPKIVTGKDQLSMIRRGLKRANQPINHDQQVTPKERYIIPRISVAAEIPPPLPNEKACQTMPVSKAVKIKPFTPLDLIKEDTKTPTSTAEEMRKERMHKTEVNRLKYLLDLVNADKPPHWGLASEMWREIDNLENRIEAYEKLERK